VDGYSVWDAISPHLTLVRRMVVVTVAFGLFLQMGWAERLVTGYASHVVEITQEQRQHEVDLFLRAVAPRPATPTTGHRSAKTDLNSKRVNEGVSHAP
jgi:hypothetical protein